MKKTSVIYLGINITIIVITSVLLKLSIFDSSEVTIISHGSALGVTLEHQKNTRNIYHFIHANEIYSPNVTIRNGYSDELLYRIYFLLNYEQIEVYYEGQIYSSIDLQLSPYSEKSINIEVPNTSMGNHELIVIAVIDPETPVYDKSIPEVLSILMTRMLIIVEEDIEITFSYDKVDNVSFEESYHFFASISPSVYRNDSISTFSVNDYDYIWLNIPVSQPNTKLAVFAILDDKQVSVYQPYFLATSTGTLHIPLKIPNTEGNLIFGVVENPYINLSNTRQINYTVPTAVRWTSITLKK